MHRLDMGQTTWKLDPLHPDADQRQQARLSDQQTSSGLIHSRYDFE